MQHDQTCTCNAPAMHLSARCSYAKERGHYLDNKAALVAGCLEEAGCRGKAPMDGPLPVQVGYPQAGLPGTAHQCHQLGLTFWICEPPSIYGMLHTWTQLPSVLAGVEWSVCVGNSQYTPLLSVLW